VIIPVLLAFQKQHGAFRNHFGKKLTKQNQFPMHFGQYYLDHRCTLDMTSLIIDALEASASAPSMYLEVRGALMNPHFGKILASSSIDFLLIDTFLIDVSGGTGCIDFGVLDGYPFKEYGV